MFYFFVVEILEDSKSNLVFLNEEIFLNEGILYFFFFIVIVF